MSRLMSFSETTDPFRDGSETVTRRAGWSSRQPGDVVTGVQKAMGLKTGERVERIHDVGVVSNRPCRGGACGGIAAQNETAAEPRRYTAAPPTSDVTEPPNRAPAWSGPALNATPAPAPNVGITL